MAFIYKIVNDINEKIYIGQTSRSVQERWREHTRDYLIRDSENRPLYRAMKKYGIEHFSISIIEEVENEKANDAEQYWIKYYDTFNNGYNATIGGDGHIWALTTPEELEQLIILYNNKKTCKEIGEILHYNEDTISAKLNQLGFKLSSVRTRKKPVEQLDKTTLQVIASYDSEYDAAKSLENPQAFKHINEVCLGKRKSAYGYIWRYK